MSINIKEINNNEIEVNGKLVYIDSENRVINQGAPLNESETKELQYHLRSRRCETRFEKKFKITIELKEGRWLVNKKPFQDCSEWERDFMNKFFQEVRIGK